MQRQIKHKISNKLIVIRKRKMITKTKEEPGLEKSKIKKKEKNSP